jgi:predicted nucleic acid-binding protein
VIGKPVRILVDSDVLADHLRGQHRFVPGDDEVHVSSITRAELFAAQRGDERRVGRLLEALVELPVDRAVADRGGRIQRAFGARLPDALIAATAIEHGLTLVTRAARDFEMIRGLRLREPAEE